MLSRRTLAFLGSFAFACAPAAKKPSPAGADAASEQGQADASKPDAGPPKKPQVKPPTFAQCQFPKCPVAFDPMIAERPEVSFAKDVYPTLQRNCSDFACHGTEPGKGAGLYLGAQPPAKVDASEIHALLVGVPSRTAPSVALVEPFDPELSFFLLKMEGCQSSLELDCVPQEGATSGDACGDKMPQGGRPICDQDRELLRTWIAQGAQDN